MNYQQQPQYQDPNAQYGYPPPQQYPQQGYNQGYAGQQQQMYAQQQPPQTVIVEKEKKDRGCLTTWYDFSRL
ncbi:hypothetical protein GLAREA_01907 [Glarea lozoyensis ATCC 20868]|uniref:Uncharacterized protein n=1 Tax=Glarea lozoyensis (strain ATCC 20868 / MF5171) TaxID=1116229 RepID=S3CJL7_GLAL2|nr:uncharacterized protein GLAREA_01907 [Glarea lozoyensis ATCC 20868]EPE25995.1 hypothetical protein GLAREA_01907 [Glarea lozoyensis ATCC 20868]